MQSTTDTIGRQWVELSGTSDALTFTTLYSNTNPCNTYANYAIYTYNHNNITSKQHIPLNKYTSKLYYS